jgi:predicted ribosome quality control (RQC) complex YloA/Tae2 family protein
MSLNCAEIDVILHELDLTGAFIQNIVQPSFDAIALYAYKGPAPEGASTSVASPAGLTGTAGASCAPDAASRVAGLSKVVLICLAPGVCRLHETRRKVPRTDKPLRFMEFLRSRVKGSRIADVTQLNDDRIIRLTLERGDEKLFMYIRLWSGAGNIIVTDEAGVIQDVFFRRPKRNEITGETWTVPTPKSAPAKTFAVRELEGTGSFNERIDLWYAEHAQALSREALVAESVRVHDGSVARLSAALARLEKKRAEFLNADQWRHQGDLLTANLWAIKQGMASVEVTDYDRDGSTVRIPLDDKLKPQENAARLYEKYRKAVSGLSDLEDDIASAKRAVESLDSWLAGIEAEQNPLVIQRLLRRQTKPRQQTEKRYPGLTFRKDGWILLVGRTAAENDELLRHHVRGLDMWLHTRDWPGGYVFIKNRAGKSVPLDILLDAGTLALFYSKGRKNGSGDLYYTQVKHLRRAKNAPKGTVLPSNEKNLSVSLDDARLKALEACMDAE